MPLRGGSELGPGASAQELPLPRHVRQLSAHREGVQHDEAFLDMPLFPTKSGLVLSHAASVRAIRAVAVKAGIPTTRTIYTTVLEKFGEHTPRVTVTC